MTVLPNWTWTQYKAAGRHAASYVAGGVTVAVAFHFISPQQGTDITSNLNTIYDGLMQVSKGVAGLAAVLLPIYTAWRAAHSASPSEQIKSVAENLSAPPATQAANAVADPASRDTIIKAVANMPEVRGVVAPERAAEIPSPKVVATPDAVKALPVAA